MAALWVLRSALVSAPPMGAALWTFQHLNAAAGPFLNPIMEQCGADVASVENPVARFVSFFNCFVVPFFSAVVATKEGTFIWGSFCALGAAYGGFQATESSRVGTRIPLSWHGVYTFVFMFIGVSIGMPLLWLPVYFLGGVRQSFATPARMAISWPRVWAVWIFNTLFFANGIAALAPWPSTTALELVIKGAVWFPIVAPFLWLLIPVPATSDAAKGTSAVVHMHCFNAGLCVTSHLALLLFVATNPEILQRMLDLFDNHEGAAACNYFLMVDLFIFWAALVYQALIEDGLLTALLIITTTPLLGIGAPLCFYYMYREFQIQAMPPKVVAAAKKKAA